MINIGGSICHIKALIHFQVNVTEKKWYCTVLIRQTIWTHCDKPVISLQDNNEKFVSAALFGQLLYSC